MDLTKRKPYRNKKILQGANGQVCQHCGIDDNTIVAAHSNKQCHGKGFSQKADDDKTAYLCAICHNRYDNAYKNTLTQEEFEVAMGKTQLIVEKNGWR